MDNADESKEQKSKRKVRSRENTAEEKRKKRKKWKKKKREAKRATSETFSVKIATGGTVKPRDQEKTASVSQKPTSPSPQNGNQMYASVISSKKPEKRVATKTHGHSRGDLMLNLAKGKSSTKAPSHSRRPKSTRDGAKDVISEISVQSKPQEPLPGPSRRNCDSIKKQLVVKELKKIELKELNPEHVDYLPQDAVGGGSFGQCFRAR